MKTVTKTYGHDCGFSAVFRQPYATSHCCDPHGYALAFSLTFACEDDEVDENGWVIDFGGLKPVKQFLADSFDHRLVLAATDPAIPDFQALYKKHGFAPPLILAEGVGCENFATFVFREVARLLEKGALGETNAQLDRKSVV